MTKKSISFVFAFLFLLLLKALPSFAGDAAAFFDLGFSSDGATYAFAQYGRRDVTFDTYADLFIIDVAKNDFLRNGVFHAESKIDSAFQTLNAVRDKAHTFTSLQEFVHPTSLQTLYTLSNDKKLSSDAVIFTDFDGVLGKQGARCVFVPNIEVEKDGQRQSISTFSIKFSNEQEKKIFGNPLIRRKKICDYRIERIFYHPTSHAIVFIIKTTDDDLNERYMAETGILNMTQEW